MSMPFRVPGGYICYPQPTTDEFTATAQHGNAMSLGARSGTMR
jgi:hypothetical protein